MKSIYCEVYEASTIYTSLSSTFYPGPFLVNQPYPKSSVAVVVVMISYAILFSCVTALFLSRSCAMCPDEVKLIIGSRTTTNSPNKPAGEGVTLVAFKNNMLITEAKLTVPFVGENPSYIAYSRPNFYLVNVGSPTTLREFEFASRFPYIRAKTAPATEGGGAYISVMSSLSIDKKFELSRILKYFSLNRIIVTADYAGSSVSTYVRTGTSLQASDVFHVPPELAAKVRNESLSNRQSVPHPHMILPYKMGIIVPDLGSDIIFYMSLSSTGKLSELSRLSLSPGDGPRHAVLHPNSDTVYVVNEISLSVVVLRSEGMLAGIGFSVSDRMNLLSDTTNKGGIKAAAIRVSADGKFLYVSVRFPANNLGKIVAFSLDSSTGDITGKLGEWSSHGTHPRDFYIIEQAQYEDECSSFLAIANLNSDNIVLVKRDMETGKLMEHATANMTVFSPTSVLEYN